MLVRLRLSAEIRREFGYEADDADSLAAVVPVPPGEKEDAETVPEGE